MTPRLSLAALLVLAALAAGCGNKSSADTSTTAELGSTTPVKPATTGTSTGPDHFTEAQWTQYKKDAAAFKKLNTKTLARVQTCAKPVDISAAALKKCVGTSLDDLFAATTELGRTLAGMTGTVSGDCEAALNGLIGYVVPYQASIKSLQGVVSTKDSRSAYASVANLETARAGGQEKAQAVNQACAP